MTGLGEEVYRKAEKNIKTDPSVRTIVAIACGLDLDLETTEKMLSLAGRSFKESDEDRALKFCITGFQDNLLTRETTSLNLTDTKLSAPMNATNIIITAVHRPDVQLFYYFKIIPTQRVVKIHRI